MNFENITKPTLLLDKQKCLDNIRLMADKARQNNLVLRPHFKTHQSRAIGKWFKQFCIHKITVSSFSMAEYFASDGWGDITVAFPVNIREINTINSLAEKIDLNITVENTEAIDFLTRNLKHRLGFFIKIDTGYNRTGVSFDIFLEIDKILKKAEKSDKLGFKGFLTHSGQTYMATGKEEVLAAHADVLHKLMLLKKQYIDKYPDLVVSMGDTPASSLADEFTGIDELRPGNFVFYDLMQYKLGSCRLCQVAVALVCPVVAKHAQRQEIVVYGGGVHFSKESLTVNGAKIYGMVVLLTNNGWMKIPEDNYLIKISQEHGIIKASKELFDNTSVGSLIAVLPVHSCMTADVMKEYLTTEGEIIDHLSGKRM